MDFLFRLFSIVKLDELNGWHWQGSIREQVLHRQFQAYQQQYRSMGSALDDNIICMGATSIGRLTLFRNSDAFVVADLSLLPEYRNGGIGTTLVQTLQTAATRESKPVQVHVVDQSEALRFCEKLGFSAIGRDGNYHLMQWVDAASESIPGYSEAISARI